MGLMSFLGSGTSMDNAWDIPVKNFGEVVDGKIYRSAAPSLFCLKVASQKIGLKAVLDLRDNWDKAEWRRYRALLWAHYGIAAYNVPFDDKSPPDPASVSIAMSILLDEGNHPILVHCQGGRHRTGGIVAEYRKRFQGYSAEAAYKEAKKYDFYSRWGHGDWKSFILTERGE